MAKQWLHIENRDFLVEAVDWRDIQQKLEALPQMAGVWPATPKNQVAQGRRFPESRLTRKTDQAIQVAALPYAAKGFVLDYSFFNPSGSQTFASGSTYYIPNSGYLGGTTTFQPGCTIKFATNAYLLMYGSIVCNGTTTSPSLLTSVDDDLIGNGEIISLSDGKPTYMASQALWIYYVTVNTEIKGMKIRWAKTAVQFDANPGSGLTHTFRDSTIEVSQTGVYLINCTGSIINATKCGVQTPISGGYSGGFTDSCSGDSDGDGLLDVWEVTYFGNTTSQNSTGDPDEDVMTNLQENQLNGNPMSPDTDDDGLPDNYERTVTLTAINNPDSDGDTIWDGGEDSDGDKLSNIAEMKGRPTATLPGTANFYVLPKKLLVYYSWPSAIKNQAGDQTSVALALTRFKEYDYVVLAGRAATNEVGLEEAYADVSLEHGDHANTKLLLSRARTNAPNTMFFGYIALATDDGIAPPPQGNDGYHPELNYSNAQITQHVQWWKNMKVDGIFFDEFGFDFMVDKANLNDRRKRQNDAVSAAHLRGLAVIANGNNADEVLGMPAGVTDAPLLGQLGGYVDFYFYEDHQILENIYVTRTDWQFKADKIIGYQTNLNAAIRRNVHVLSVTTTIPSQPYTQTKFWYSWHSAFLFSHEATGWGEPGFSSDDDLAPLRPRPSITDAGTVFATVPAWNAPGTHINMVTRYTDGADGVDGNEGRIRVDAASGVNTNGWWYPTQAP